VQDVGLAPTDDGFTMLVYGETEEDFCGPAAAARLPAEFARIEDFGGGFMQHLRIKVRNRPLLKSVTLIDSPGMIDTVEHTVNRSYDFKGVVRYLAEMCDMVFFLLDPDKPGTTGETVNVFSQCLAGMESKLNVLFNKCDAFASLYDFARTYGTVCWNLARVLQTKDLPKIWTIYSGEERKPGEASLDLTDFNRHRDEFLGIVRDGAARRRDNVFSQARRDFLGLSVRMRVVNHAARATAGRTALAILCGILAAPFCYFGAALVLPRISGTGPTLAHVIGGLAAALCLFATYFVSRLVAQSTRDDLSRRVNDVFETEYRRDVAVGQRDDLKEIWAGVRDETASVIRDAPLGKLPLFGEFQRMRLDAAAEKVFAAFRGEP
jgi:hypothetical protein